jgi:hypothetical protein
MKRLEIVAEAKRLDDFVRVVQTHATGYTVVPDVTGIGEHGLHQADLALLVTIVTIEHLEAIIDGVLPLLNERANIVTISDVSVLRAEHFIPEVRNATAHTPA